MKFVQAAAELLAYLQREHEERNRQVQDLMADLADADDRIAALERRLQALEDKRR